MPGPDGRWLPGESGNPKGYNGRESDQSFREEVRRILRVSAHSGDRTRLQLLAQQMVEGALEGNPLAMRELWKRLWPETLVVQDERSAESSEVDGLLARLDGPGDEAPEARKPKSNGSGNPT